LQKVDHKDIKEPNGQDDDDDRFAPNDYEDQVADDGLSAETRAMMEA
jgi:hypothetical protein